MQPGYDSGQTIHKFTTPPTAAEDAASIERSRKLKGKVEASLKITLAEVESDHFLIFTDWDPKEYAFLKEQCEGAYRVCAHQFARKPEDNVFVGKLPIFMFAKQSDFMRFARATDKASLPPTVLGYFISDNELGHMAMWKPSIGDGGIGAGINLADAERKWGRTLVHEFTHAFIHRYQSDASIPRWLNEGVAEVVAESVLPTNNYHAYARQAAIQDAPIQQLFDDSNMPSGAYYPVMMTMAELLAKQDGKAFIQMFKDIKDGVEPESVLRNDYHIDYGKLESIWRTYARALR